ncbi:MULTISPECIES: acyltransferase family protein [unclassified Pseudoalteromonas]|uniref:acyltransferase family protein n=1 Tax=unclassified Pseudoalteromonas TaxID=194690 RepID=UPI0006948CE1|nr:MULTISPECIES: acyltransferase family protein [unclassified Pseudoalteromonas]
MSLKINNLSWISSLFIPDKKDMPERRHDLDWLRIAVFTLLILFHSGMFYTANWGWHVKSNYQSQTLESIMLLVEPWRMAVLWLIAGISIKFIMAKVSIWRFISIRSFRLLLPLLFGILVIVPPQLYIEMTHNGDLNMNYWQFLTEFFATNSNVFEKYQSGIWPHIDVNHLWFIRALWQYSLIILCLLPLLNSKFVNHGINWLFNQNTAVVIFIATLPLFIIQVNWDLDTVRYPIGFTLMLYGYLIGWHKVFWLKITNNLKPLIYVFITCYVIVIIFYNGVWIDIIKGGQTSDEWLIMLGLFNYSLLRVIGAFMVFSIAYKYFNLPSKKLSYLNDAVYPFYILHQSLIVVFGYQLSQFNLGPIIEPLILIVLTIAGCLIGFEVIRRTDILRPLFGLKVNNNYRLEIQKMGYTLSSLFIFIIGLEILI